MVFLGLAVGAVVLAAASVVVGFWNNAWADWLMIAAYVTLGAYIAMAAGVALHG